LFPPPPHLLALPSAFRHSADAAHRRTRTSTSCSLERAQLSVINRLLLHLMQRCLMWSLRGFSPVGRTLSSQFTPLQSSQPRCCRAICEPSVASAAHHRWSSMLTFQKDMNITRSFLSSIPPTINNSALTNLTFCETRRCMSKFLSKSATKRLPLTTKRAGKGYYKGKGCTSEGRLTSKGKFIADPVKKLQLIVPDLTGFTLKPYIARTVAKSPPKDQTSVASP
ncbi:hypothetical protein ACHAXH_004453, partial [Discostella pseudostelligera]